MRFDLDKEAFWGKECYLDVLEFWDEHFLHGSIVTIDIICYITTDVFHERDSELLGGAGSACENWYGL